AAAAAASGQAVPAARPVPGRVSAALASRDPAAALAGLAWLRTEAIRTRSTGLLDDVNVADSAAMAADREIIGALLARDHWLSGLETGVGSVEPAAASGTTAVLSAVVTTSAFQEHSRAGLVREAAEPKEQRLKVRLEHVDGRWLVSAVLPPDG
ncbi:serine/threonine protein kinase, partial [Arthrobacter sp. GCM10027362]